MRMSRFQRTPQRRARPEQMRLPSVFVQHSRAQSIGEGAIRTVAGHLPGRPITSTPGGGVKVKRSGISLTLRCVLVKVSRVT